MVRLDSFRLATEDRHVDGLFVRSVRPLDPSPHHVPLLMLHGAFEGWWVYQKWLSYFATSGWPCNAMSLRNHAGSSRLSDDALIATGVADYVADVRTVIASLDRAPVLVGHSLGGLIAQKVAESEALEALVLVASAGPAQLGAYGPPLPPDCPVDIAPATREEAQATTLDENSFEEYLRALQPESPRALMAIRGRTRVARDKIRCPILVIGAGAEQYEIHGAEELARFYECEYFVVPASRHGVMFESEALIAAVKLERWLTRVLPSESSETR
jgi:pimeloyl-ACP methyl ester carboxylesterase